MIAAIQEHSTAKTYTNMTFKTINLGDGLYSIEYVPQKATNNCEGCFARANDALCMKLPNTCLTDGVVFVRRMEIVGDCV